MNKNKKTIIITGGGTLGHIFPFLPIVYKIYKNYNLYYIGTKKGIEEQYFKKNDLNKYFKNCYYLDMIGINRQNIFKNFNMLIKYFKVKMKINCIYKELDPDLIIGMGGYISGVCINIGVKRKIKTIIHEQNAVLGLANKLVSKKVNKLLLSYDIKDLNSKNVAIIGNPRYSYVKENYSNNEQNTILIVGGSLGSKFINDLIVDNNEYFNFDNYKIKLVVGKKYYENNINKIKNINNKNLIIYDFIDDLINEISKATLVVSRSGATTISELMALRKPSILIPSPNVVDNHQYYNALTIYNNGCCSMIEECELTKEKLYNNIIEIITTYEYKNKITMNIDKLYNNDPLNDFIKIIKEEI